MDGIFLFEFSNLKMCYGFTKRHRQGTCNTWIWIVFYTHTLLSYSAMLRKEMVHIYDTQSTEGYCDVILIKN